MGSDAVLALDDLLQPISDDRPTGEDLREDLAPSTVYYEVKDVRTAARNAERQGEFENVIGSAEAGVWRPIVGKGTEILKTRAKDLEIVAWMIEALVRTHGFAGLRDGLKLARGMVEKFWEGIYPLPDEDGIETTVAPITGLGLPRAGTLLAPIARIPITQGSSIEPLATWSCRQAQELERLAEDARAERASQGATTMEEVQTVVRETMPDFFATTVADIEACLEEWKLLAAALDERAGADSPPASAVREALEQALETVRFIARDVMPSPEPEAEEPGEPDPQGGGGGGAAAPPPAPRAGLPGSIASRDEAFKALNLVAEYFRKNEPHSPLSFLIERTVRWGRLPLPELLAELIPDAGARNTYSQLTGVAPDDQAQ